MFFNYTKPGKGVEKRDPNKKRTAIFFEIFFRKFWSLCKANMLYVICCIPAFVIMLFVSGILTSGITDYFTPFITQSFVNGPAEPSSGAVELQITLFDMVLRTFSALLFTIFLGAGPVTAGFTYILRNYAREEHVWLVSDMWQRSKSNFGQAIVVWIVDILAFVVLTVAFKFYLGLPGPMSYLACIIAFITLVYIMMHFYIYQLMVTFELKLKDLYKNSILLVFAEAPKNLAIFVIMVLIHIFVPYFGTVMGNMPLFLPVFLLLELIILIAASWFMTNFFVYSTVEKFIDAAQKNNGCDDEIL